MATIIVIKKEDFVEQIKTLIEDEIKQTYETIATAIQTRYEGSPIVVKLRTLHDKTKTAIIKHYQQAGWNITIDDLGKDKDTFVIIS